MAATFRATRRHSWSPPPFPARARAVLVLFGRRPLAFHFLPRPFLVDVLSRPPPRFAIAFFSTSRRVCPSLVLSFVASRDENVTPTIVSTHYYVMNIARADVLTLSNNMSYASCGTSRRRGSAAVEKYARRTDAGAARRPNGQSSSLPVSIRPPACLLRVFFLDAPSESRRREWPESFGKSQIDRYLSWTALQLRI